MCSHMCVCACVCVAVSSGCHNKFPHIECLKTTEIYAHGFEGQKSKIKTVLLEGAREIMLPCLFQLLAASSKPWLVAVAPVSPSSWVCLKLPLPSSWNDTGQGTCIIQVDFISKFICKNCFCEEAHTQVPVIWHGLICLWTYLFGSCHSTHYTVRERVCVCVCVHMHCILCQRRLLKPSSTECPPVAKVTQFGNHTGCWKHKREHERHSPCLMEVITSQIF